MRTTTPVLVLIAALSLMATGCGRTTTSPSPASPTSVDATEDVLAEQMSVETLSAPVGLTGVVRSIDARTHSFTLATRAGSRLVRTDERTEVWRSGTRVRLTAVREGMTVGVRGQDGRRFVLARTISIMR